MKSNFAEISPGFFISADFAPLLRQMRLDSVEAVFAFAGGEALVKAELAAWRRRIRFQLPDGRFAYLKRYDNPPAGVQIKSWLQHGKRAFLSDYDRGPEAIVQAGVKIPETIAFGGRWLGVFERRSFIISLEIPEGQSLEKKLPECFEACARAAAHGQVPMHRDAAGSQRQNAAAAKKDFIRKAAEFVRRFHATGYRHRDLYLCHLFLSGGDTLYLIDLHRCFRPKLMKGYYTIKDLAQLHYSCPAERVSRTDRVRFFIAYRQHQKLTDCDKRDIRRIHQKAQRMAAHSRRHGRAAPFEGAAGKEAVTC